MDPERYGCNLCQRALRMSSSKAFIVSSLSSRSLIHFGFALEHGVKRECSCVHFSHAVVLLEPLAGGLCLLPLCVVLSWADSPVSCLVSGPCCTQSSSSRVKSCLLSASLLTALSDFDLGAVLIPGLLRLGPQAQGRAGRPVSVSRNPGASAAEESRCSVHDK